MQPATEASATEIVAPSYARALPRRRSNSRRWWISGAVGLALIVTVVGVGSRSFGVLDRLFGRGGSNLGTYVVRPVDLSITLTEDGELKPKDSVNVKCEIEGRATILWVVEESTRVNKGDPLVVLADEDIKERIDTEEIELSRISSNLEAAREDLEITKNENASKLKKAQIDLDVAELELEKYLKGDYEKALKAIEISIKQTDLDITRIEEDLRKNRDLMERGFVMKSKVDLLKIELQKAQMTRDQHERERQILEQYEFKKNDKQKTSAVEQAREELGREEKRARSREKQAEAKLEEQEKLLAMREKRLQRLKEQRDKCKIFAPVDGVVQYPQEGRGWRDDNRIVAGETAYEGQTLVVLPDTSQMVVETRIHEADRHKVEEGLRCLVTVPAVPGRTFTGQVSKIARFADSANRWLNPELKEHTTEILLDETDASLSPGDSAEIKILIANVSNTLTVPVQCVFSRGSRSFVFSERGGGITPVEVKLGRSNTTMVEVVEGLSAGDDVLMHAGEELLAMLPAPSADQAELKEPPPQPEERPRPETPQAGPRGKPGSKVAGRPDGQPRRPAAKADSQS